MGKIIVVILLTFTNACHADNAEWVNEWWGNDFSTIQAKQKELIINNSNDSCSKSLSTQRTNMRRFPNDEYYKWQYDAINKQCLSEDN